MTCNGVDHTLLDKSPPAHKKVGKWG
jgi:hypothetical protein